MLYIIIQSMRTSKLLIVRTPCVGFANNNFPGRITVGLHISKLNSNYRKKEVLAKIIEQFCLFVFIYLLNHLNMYNLFFYSIPVIV